MSDLTTAEYALIAADFAARYADGYVGVGTGITPFTGAETDLQGASKARAPVTSVSVSGAVVTLNAEFAPGVATFEWNEAAAFTAASGGHMAAAKVISSPGTKGASDRWTYALEITLADS